MRSLSIETSVDKCNIQTGFHGKLSTNEKDDANGVMLISSFSPVEARYVKVMIGSEQFPDLA